MFTILKKKSWIFKYSQFQKKLYVLSAGGYTLGRSHQIGDRQKNEHEQKTRAHRRQLGRTFKTKNTGRTSPKEKTMYT